MDAPRRLQGEPRRNGLPVANTAALRNVGRTLLIGALLAWWSEPTAVQAQAVLGSEFQINTHTTGEQLLPTAAVTSGGFVVVWRSFSQDNLATYGVFGQRFDSDGSVLGTEFRVNSYTTADQWYPGVAAAANGDFVVVWSSELQDGDSFGVLAQRYASNGGELGTEFLVNTYTTSSQNKPAVAAADNGDFVVVWGSFGQDNHPHYGVFGQRFTSNGAPAGTEFQVNTYTTGFQGEPSVAGAADGDFVVVWTSYDGESTGIFGQRFASGGGALGTEFRVNTYTTYIQRGASIAADSDGDFVVVWGSDYQDGENFGVFGQRYASGGGALGAEFQVNTQTAYDQSYFVSTDDPPHVAMDASGAFVVVWSSYYQDGDSWGVFGQSFNSNGSTQGAEFRINTTTGDFQKFASVAAGDSGEFVVAWTSYYQDGHRHGVFGQRYDQLGSPAAPGCPAEPLPGCDTPGKSILLIKDDGENGASANDKLIWKWIMGPPTMQSDFGDPTATADYAFCIYSGTAQVLTAEVPASLTCGGGDCWSAISTKGYKRKDKAGSTDGITLILLKGGPGSPKIVVKGKGAALDLTAATLPLDDTATATVQLSHSDNSNCWQGTFPVASFKKNSKSQFKAKAP